MSNSVGMKVRKKQPSLSPHQPPADARSAALEQSLLNLESVCVRILDTRFAGRGDEERMYWQQRFKNIVTPVSLALAEYRGTPRFHYHYRHSEEDDTKLRPVAGPDPIDLVAQTCAHALRQCQGKLVGLQDMDLMDHERLLEHALQHFLMRYKNYKARR